MIALARKLVSSTSLTAANDNFFPRLVHDDITSVEDQRNNATTYTYNAFGDVVGETSPDRGSIS